MIFGGEISLAKFEVHWVKGLREIAKVNYFESVKPFHWRAGWKKHLSIWFCFCFVPFHSAPKFPFTRVHCIYALVFHGVNIALHVFCWFALRFPEKQAKNAVRPIWHCRKAGQDINGQNEHREATQAKYRKYYTCKSGSTLAIRHFNSCYRIGNGHNFYPDKTLFPLFDILHAHCKYIHVWVWFLILIAVNFL